MSPAERPEGNRTEQLQRKYRNGTGRIPVWTIPVSALGSRQEHISRKRIDALRPKKVK